MSVVGPSGCGKTQFVYNLLHFKIFQPPFDKIFFFYKHFQPIYQQMQHEFSNIEFLSCIDFQLVQELPSDGTNYLMIFDDSCVELLKSKEFEKIATSGRHRGISVIYIKHNLYHKSPIGRDVELQNTHIVLFKSPRDVLQISKLAQQLGVSLIEWYKDATSKPYGHLLIDLHPQTLDVLRFSSGFEPTIFYLPTAKARITNINDKHTARVYAEYLSDFPIGSKEKIPPTLSKTIHKVPLRMSSKHYKRKTTHSRIELKKYESQIRRLIIKSTTYRERRTLLASPKGLVLIEKIYPFVIKHFDGV